jgi:hypothetical protein
MTKPVSTDIVFANNQLKPLEYNGVKLMSMGFINKGASIMRGPMVNQVCHSRTCFPFFLHRCLTE